MVVRWLICRDLSCKLRVFALRDKGPLWAAADVLSALKGSISVIRNPA
jgi:hypothetical protein